jgi:hypothetical protein
MANSLASLVVKLGLDAVEFTSGLTKAENQAQQFGKKFESAGKSITKFVATLGIGYVIQQFVSDTISAASALDDLADATGSSVEELSKLKNQAEISGTSFETLQGLVLKLTAGMAGADDESSNVGRALKFLGVSAKDPAEALQQVAVALDKYADGTGKAALARDLFGKSGPAFLATLKDIAKLQDVAATTSTKQAEEAEKLEQGLRRLKQEGLVPLRDFILSQLVPAGNQFIDWMKRARAEANTLESIGDAMALGFRGAGDAVRYAQQELDKVKAKRDEVLAGGGRVSTLGDIDKYVQTAERRLKIALDAQKLMQQGLGWTGDVRDIRAGMAAGAGAKPEAAYTGTKVGAGAAAKGVDEYARALETVAKMAAGAQVELDALTSGTDKLTQAEKKLAELKADDVWKKFTTEQQAAIEKAYANVTAIEKETNAVIRRREEYDKSIEAMQHAAEAETRVREATAKTVADYTASNDVLERQIAIIGQGELAHQKLAAAIEYERLREEALKNMRYDAVAALDKQYERRLKLLDAQDAANKAFEKQQEELRKSKQFADDLANAFANATEEALLTGKSFKDVMKGLEQDLLRILTRKLITEPLANALSGMLGGATGGGGLLASLASMFAGGTSGGGAIGTPSFIGPPSPYASGTRYARGGISLVGERGPELMYIPRGAQIIPNERLVEKRSERTTVYNTTVNVLPGATRISAAQAAAAQTRRQLQASRNT